MDAKATSVLNADGEPDGGGERPDLAGLDGPEVGAEFGRLFDEHAPG